MQPQSVVSNAMDLAKAAIAQGGKPSAVKVKVKFDNAKKVKTIKKRASQSAYHIADKGVTR